MRIFSFLSTMFSGGAGKPEPSERTGQRKDHSAPELRATAEPGINATKPISERKSVSLRASLNRIWITLKYRSELDKAASDCRKFLVSLSGPRLDLSTVTPLCNPLPKESCAEFESLFNATINDAIKKFAEESKKSRYAAQMQINLKNNMELFINKRKEHYIKAFNIAKEYEIKFIAAPINADKPAKANFV